MKTVLAYAFNIFLIVIGICVFVSNVIDTYKKHPDHPIVVTFGIVVAVTLSVIIYSVYQWSKKVIDSDSEKDDEKLTK